MESPPSVETITPGSDEHVSLPPLPQLSTEEEKQYVDQFANQYADLFEEIEAAKERNRDLEVGRKKILQSLRQYMIENGQTCIPVTVGDTPETEREIYLRVIVQNKNRTPSLKEIEAAQKRLIEDPSILQTTLAGMSVGDNGPQKPTLFAVFVEAMHTAITESTRYTTERIDLFEHAEEGMFPKGSKRKRSPTNIQVHTLDKQANRNAFALYKIKQEQSANRRSVSSANATLRYMRQDYAAQSTDNKQGDGHDDDEEEELSSRQLAAKRRRIKIQKEKQAKHQEWQTMRDVLAGYIRRLSPEAKSIAISMESETGEPIKYYLREKESRKTPEFPNSKLKDVIAECARELFLKSEVSLDSVCEPSHLNQLQYEPLLDHMVINCATKINEYRLSRVSKVRKITLDKARVYKGRKASTKSREKKPIARWNVLGEEIEEEEEEGERVGGEGVLSG